MYNDKVMVYNILHGHVSVSEKNLISCNNPVINTTISTRGHGVKLKTTPFRLDITKTFVLQLNCVYLEHTTHSKLDIQNTI